ncbi:hypothetical protein DXG03_005571, partial [Asterophora parasitica]
ERENAMKKREEEREDAMKTREEEREDTVKELKDTITGLEESQEHLNKEIRPMKKTIDCLQKIVGPLHRRAIVDEARNQLLEMYQISPRNYATAKLLLAAVKERMITVAWRHLLSADALDLIFLPSAIRNAGNLAVQASAEDLSFAIVSTSLEERDRKALREIY